MNKCKYCGTGTDIKYCSKKCSNKFLTMHSLLKSFNGSITELLYTTGKNETLDNRMAEIAKIVETVNSEV